MTGEALEKRLLRCLQGRYRVAENSALPSLQGESSRWLITLDGPCAGGKTTLAALLAKELGAAVVHTDDFVVPHAQKTAERLALPGGNCDVERLTAEVVLPWKQGRTVRFQRYDCMADCLCPAEELPSVDVLILEGSYCNLPAIRQRADVRLFLQADWPTRLARLQLRESPESLRRFEEKWIPLENAYFAHFGLPDAGCLVLK